MNQIEPYPSHTPAVPRVQLNTGVECRTPFPFLDGYGSTPSEAHVGEEQLSPARGTAQPTETTRSRANEMRSPEEERTEADYSHV